MGSSVLLAAGSAAESHHLRRTLEVLGFSVEEADSADVVADGVHTLAIVLSGRGSLDAVRRIAVRALDDRPLLLYSRARRRISRPGEWFRGRRDAVLPASAADQEVAAQLCACSTVGKYRGGAGAIDPPKPNFPHSSCNPRTSKSTWTCWRLGGYRRASCRKRCPRSAPLALRCATSRAASSAATSTTSSASMRHHVGFYLADAMGHGVPAGLLTVFLKRAVQLKEVTSSTYRLVPPDEVLARPQSRTDRAKPARASVHHDDLRAARLPNRRVQLARAGHPHPIFVPRTGELETLAESRDAFGSI